jgi:hypothetical protein
MSYTTSEGDLIATAVPAVQVNTDLPLLADAYASVSGTAPAARSFSHGDTSTVVPKLNENALRLDLLARYGGASVRAVAAGLALSVPSGLSATVAAGHGLIDGIVEVPTDITGTLLTNGAQNYLWLLQNGTIQNVPGSLTPPAGQAVYLGRITTAAGAATAVNYTGVVRALGGLRYRKTGDPAAPGDTPPAAAFLLGQTAGGLYLWNGTAWVRLGAAAAPPSLTVRSVSAATTLATTDDILLVDTSGGAVTVTLPDPTTVAVKRYLLKKTSSGANSLSAVNGGGAWTIDGASSKATTTAYGAITVIPGGPGLWIVENVV